MLTPTSPWTKSYSKSLVNQICHMVTSVFCNGVSVNYCAAICTSRISIPLNSDTLLEGSFVITAEPKQFLGERVAPMPVIYGCPLFWYQRPLLTSALAPLSNSSSCLGSCRLALQWGRNQWLSMRVSSQLLFILHGWLQVTCCGHWTWAIPMYSEVWNRSVHTVRVTCNTPALTWEGQTACRASLPLGISTPCQFSGRNFVSSRL